MEGSKNIAAQDPPLSSQNSVETVSGRCRPTPLPTPQKDSQGEKASWSMGARWSSMKFRIFAGANRDDDDDEEEDAAAEVIPSTKINPEEKPINKLSIQEIMRLVVQSSLHSTSPFFHRRTHHSPSFPSKQNARSD